MTLNTKNQSQGNWLSLARLLYLALFATGIYLTIVSLPWQLDPETYICTREPCGFETVAPAELQPLEQFGLTPELYMLYRFWTDIPPILTLFLGVSLLIFLLRSDEGISLLSATFLCNFPVAIFASDFSDKMVVWRCLLQLFGVIGGASIVVLFYISRMENSCQVGLAGWRCRS